MKYAVEARVFDHGFVTVKIREAAEDEESYVDQTRSCEIFVDIFDDSEIAAAFAKSYFRK